VYIAEYDSILDQASELSHLPGKQAFSYFELFPHSGCAQVEVRDENKNYFVNLPQECGKVIPIGTLAT